MIEEVTIISSDSEPLPRQKFRRVTWKVRFSHPLAYQDPQFLLKQQIHESRRHTRTNKDADLSSGLPDASRKRRTEVISKLYPFHPLAGVIRQPLNSSDSNYQETSPSSATLCSRICRLSRPCPGSDDHLMLYFAFTYTFVLNLFVFSVPRQNSAKGRRRTNRSKSRTCLNRR